MLSHTSESDWRPHASILILIDATFSHSHSALQYTLHCQFSEKKESPFEAEAKRHGIKYPGGKVDDIGIVVALVVDERLKGAKL